MKGALPATVFAVAMAAFGLSAHREEFALARFVPLGVATVALFSGIVAAGSPRWWAPGPRWGRWLAGNVLVGALLAVWFRAGTGQTALPARLTWFAGVAATIGVAEEFAWRGFVQGAFRRWGIVLAIVVAAVAHTAYKTCLFVLPDVDARANLWVLAVATLLGGLLLGWARERGAGLVFPMAGHAVFDVVAYGDLTSAPWWI